MSYGDTHSIKRVYCDGIFDLFHKGHLLHLEKIHKQFQQPIHLLAGVISDNAATTYKRRPIFNETQRLKILSSCIYVDEAFVTDVLILDEAFIEKHSIDYVIHAFNDPKDKDKQNEFFAVPIRLGKFVQIDYNDGISTTQIIKENNVSWADVWEKKGVEDLYFLNEWENSPQSFVTNVIQKLEIEEKAKILEMGCGEGLLAYLLKNYDYTGTDSSISFVTKHIQVLNNVVLHFRSSDTLFKTDCFDYTLINGRLEFLTNAEELDKTINEAERISQKGIYIGDIREKTERDGQLAIAKYYFLRKGYTILQNLYDPKSYDAFIRFNTL